MATERATWVVVFLAAWSLGACGDGSSNEQAIGVGGTNNNPGGTSGLGGSGGSGGNQAGTSGASAQAGMSGAGAQAGMGGASAQAGMSGVGGTSAGQGGGAGVSGGPGCQLTGCSDTVAITLFVSVEVSALSAQGFELCIEGACSNLGPRTPELNPDLAHYDYTAPLAGALTGDAKLRSLNPGTLVVLNVRLTPQLIGDGARFTLRIASSPPYALERFVTYSTRMNTPGCAPLVCHEAALRLFPHSKTGLTCTAKACDSGVRIRTKIPRAPSSLDFSTLRFCRNAVCSSLTLTSGSGFEQGLLTGGGTLRGALPSGYFESGDRTSLSLTLTSSEDGYQLKDGDRYTIDVVDRAGSMLHHEEHAVDYVESFPNGQECDTEACRYATLGP